MVSPAQLAGSKPDVPVTDFTDLGVRGLDYVLGQGLPVDSVLMLTGAPGTHYTTLAQQALHNHVVAMGKVALYTAEAASRDIMMDMALYGWKIRDYVDDGSWVFVRMLPPQLQKLVDLMPETPYEVRVQLSGSSLAGLTQDFAARLKEGRWTALDLSLLINAYPQQEVADLVLFWVNAVHAYGGVHFLLVTQGAHEERQVTYLKSLVDGVFSFKVAQGYGRMEGEIEIEKLRRVVQKTRTLRYIVSNDGVEIETTARIG